MGWIMIFLERLNSAVWGIPTLILILGVGIFITVRNGFPQVTLFSAAIKDFFSKCRPGKKGNSGRSSYRALCTALASTVGTGNIAGVAGAITVGGPGSIFWMWVSAFLGMATKYAEATLAVRYRTKDGSGNYMGGPMFMIQRGLSPKWHLLGNLY